MNINGPEYGHLYDLYLKWKESPKVYGQEMATTVDKIIYSTLARSSLEPIYRRTEDRDDLIQELRLLCFQKLNNIHNPTNKRIFNFLRISVLLALKDKTRKVGRRLDRELIESNILTEHSTTLDSPFYFNDSLLENVATLLSEGYNKEEIIKATGLTKNKLERQIGKLRKIYNEKRSV